MRLLGVWVFVIFYTKINEMINVSWQNVLCLKRWDSLCWWRAGCEFHLLPLFFSFFLLGFWGGGVCWSYTVKRSRLSHWDGKHNPVYIGGPNWMFWIQTGSSLNYNFAMFDHYFPFFKVHFWKHSIKGGVCSMIYLPSSLWERDSRLISELDN